MKKLLGVMILALTCLVVQPTNVLNADDAVTKILGKAQELAEKQKIKGKILKEFITNNVITVDYEGEERAYKFNTDITYEVYVGKKITEQGTWAIKGLTKSSIKLIGHQDLYIQIYKSKERISTLTNLKKKNDSQTNRRILKISSLSDFEKQLTQSEPEKPKELEEKKKAEVEKSKEEEEKKAEEKSKEEEKRIAEEKRKEEEKKAEEKRKAEELASSKEPLVNDTLEFGRVVKYYSINLSDVNSFSQDKYRFACEMKRPSDPDQLYYKKYYILILDLKTAFKHMRLGIKYQRSDRDYLETMGITVLDAKGTVITFAFGRNKSNPKNIYQIDYGDKTKFTINRIKPTPKTGPTPCVRDKLWDDAKKYFNAYHKKEDDKKQKLKAKREKKYKEQQDFNNSPEGQLYNAYLSYMRIKGYYAARKGYAIVFVTSIQMSDAKSKIKEIEDTIVAKNKIDSDAIWKKAVEYYKDNEKGWMDGIISSGTYSKHLSENADSNLFAVTSIHSDVTGGTKIEKDF